MDERRERILVLRARKSAGAMPPHELAHHRVTTRQCAPRFLVVDRHSG
jgi:hypothetical protein